MFEDYFVQILLQHYISNVEVNITLRSKTLLFFIVLILTLNKRYKRYLHDVVETDI